MNMLTYIEMQIKLGIITQVLGLCDPAPALSRNLGLKTNKEKQKSKRKHRVN